MSDEPRSGLLLRRLPFPLLLALRYLRSTRRDAFAGFLSVVAAAGIALGVAALILVMAALAGLHRMLLGQVLAGTPQIEVELPLGSDGAAVAAVATRLAAVPGVVRAERLVRGQGWLVVEGAPVPLKLVGFTGELPASFPEATDHRPGFYLPADLVRRWHLEVGQRIPVVSPRPTLTPFGLQPRLRALELAGTFETYAADPVQRAALPFDVAESLLGSGSRLIEVSTGDLDRALALAPRLAAELPAGSRLATWKDLNHSLYFVLRLEKSLLFVAVSLIVLVAALALVVDLALLIASKRAEIGMLGAMGARRRQIRAAFLYLGSLLAACGLIPGATLGIATAWLLDRFQLLSVPGQVMFVSYIPFRVEPWDLTLILTASVLLVLASSLSAARRASALQPVEAMRT